MPGVRTVIVSPEQAGQKLDQFLRRAVGGHIPGGAIMRWIRTGQVRVDGGRAKPFQRVLEGQKIRIPPHDDPPEVNAGPSFLGSASDLVIVHQDHDLIVLNKPAGLPVQPGTGHADALTTRLAARFAGAPFVPVPAHRLDRDTTGLVLAAATHGCLRQLQAWFRDAHAIRKTYLAWVSGEWSLGEVGRDVELRDTLIKDGAPGKEKMRALAGPERNRDKPGQGRSGQDGADLGGNGQGKEAHATARALAVRDGMSLLSLELHTGRTHQLRVQLAERGHPILGDHKYGGPPCGQGLLLHAWRIELPDGRAFACPPAWMGRWAAPDLRG